MTKTNIGYYFLVMASVVIVLAGVKSASVILVPFLLSLFIAIILSPSYNYFISKKVPSSLSLLLVIGIFVLFLGLIVKLVGTSVSDFSANTDIYADKLSKYYLVLLDFTQNLGIEIPADKFSTLLDPKKINGWRTLCTKDDSNSLP